MEDNGKALDIQIDGNHYKQFKIQPVEFIYANGIGYMEGNVIKYMCRHHFKNGKQDLLKARHYIDIMLQLDYPDDPIDEGDKAGE
jgi:hypothetical protein